MNVTHVLAQVGIGDTPEWVLWMVFLFVPLHLLHAVTGDSAIKLIGFGSAALTAQISLLLFWLTFLLYSPFYTKKWRRIKTGGCLLLYPAVVFSTNLLPALLSG